jgi:type III secretion protein Q
MLIETAPNADAKPAGGALLTLLAPQANTPPKDWRECLLLPREPVPLTLVQRKVTLVLQKGAQTEGALVLPLLIGTNAIRLYLSRELVEWLQQPLALDGSVLDEEPAQQAMLLELASLDLLRPLEAHLGQPIRFGEGEAADLPVSVGARIAAGTETFLCRLELTDALGQALADGLDRLQPPQQPDLSGTAIDIVLEAGAQDLTAAELESLQPGDVVMLDPAFSQAVMGGKLAASIQRSAEGFQLTGSFAPLPGRAAPETSDLCRVAFEFCRLPSTLGAIEQLVPGSHLPVAVADQTGVDIVLQDRRIGRGELVRIGEGTGVRVVHLATTAAKAAAS